MDIYPDFHGPHADGRRPDAEAIAWQHPVQRFHSVRIVRHTCDCREEIYEFCAGGGLAWIRTTDRSPSAPVVRESHPSPYGAALELWRKVMNGEAR